jgi:hypothetical protein
MEKYVLHMLILETIRWKISNHVYWIIESYLWNHSLRISLGIIDCYLSVKSLFAE